MAASDPRVDAYIRNAQPFARPILTHLRRVVHLGCPEADETMKWNAPHFDYHGMLCGMAAFQAHVAFGFWKASLLDGHLPVAKTRAMGQFGKVTSLQDLPPEATLVKLVRTAARLNEAGEQPARTPRVAKRPAPRAPADLRAALAKSPRAKATFAAFSPSHKRDYIEWLTEAKRAETRARRLAQAIAWMVEGKSRNWKYT